MSLQEALKPDILSPTASHTLKDSFLSSSSVRYLLVNAMRGRVSGALEYTQPPDDAGVHETHQAL